MSRRRRCVQELAMRILPTIVHIDVELLIDIAARVSVRADQSDQVYHLAVCVCMPCTCTPACVCVSVCFCRKSLWLNCRTNAVVPIPICIPACVCLSVCMLVPVVSHLGCDDFLWRFPNDVLTNVECLLEFSGKVRPMSTEPIVECRYLPARAAKHAAGCLSHRPSVGYP